MKFRLVLIYDRPSTKEHLTARLFIPAACLTLRGERGSRAGSRALRRRRFVYAKQPATELERRTLKNNLHI